MELILAQIKNTDPISYINSSDSESETIEKYLEDIINNIYQTTNCTSKSSPEVITHKIFSLFNNITDDKKMLGLNNTKYIDTYEAESIESESIESESIELDGLE